MVPPADRTSSGRPIRGRFGASARALLRRGLPSALTAFFWAALVCSAQDLTFPGGMIWQVTLTPPPIQTPAFDDRQVYLVLADGTVRAIDHGTGAERWAAKLAASVKPASSGEILAGADGKIAWAVDAQSGRAAWTGDLGAAAASVVAAAPGALYLTAADDLVLLAWADGRERIRLHLPARPATAVVARDAQAWIGLEDGRIMAIGLADGAALWTKTPGGRPIGLTPLGDRLAAGSADNFLYLLKAANGSTSWRWRTGGDVTGLATADSRRVYYTALDAMLRAADRRHGDLRWQRPLASRPVGAPLLAGDLVIVAGVSPELRAYRTSDGGLMGSAPLPGRPLHGPFLASPAGLAPPRLVLLTAGGYLIALGQTVEPMIVPLLELPGRVLPPEVLPDIKR